MQSSFKDRIQNPNGYADQPFTFLDPDADRLVVHIASIDLIENGDRRARENWQKKQLGNLTNHAYVRSSFWRQRIPVAAGRQDVLPNLPILTRKDTALQVQQEGSLADKKHGSGTTYETSGSTGTPLKVFICEQNSYYNGVRSLAQFFIDDLPLDENRVQIANVVRGEDLKKESGSRSFEQHWAGPLSKVYRNGSNKKLRFNKDIGGLLEQLSKDRVGYLVSPSRMIEQLLDHGGPDLVKGTRHQTLDSSIRLSKPGCRRTIETGRDPDPVELFRGRNRAYRIRVHEK